LAAELGLPPGGVFLDYPVKPRMMGLDLLLKQRDGATQRLTEGGRAGIIDLPRVSEELYHSARVLRVFSVERRAIPPAPVLDLLRMIPAELTRRLARPEALL
ncbi:MAG TPA: hypothetical protein VFU47_03995, partial [Armatimonadota bacterium]|nr:hypothetical protein [Armatimonadota bacterium]